MRFGARLQELREVSGLSQSALAAASGVPVWTIRAYEQGRREPLWNVLFKLAEGLGVDCRAFANCDKDGTPASPTATGKPAVGKKRVRKQKE